MAKTDNCRWATRGEQKYNSRQSKLTKEQVIEARQKHAEGLTGLTLSKLYSVSHSTMCRALSGTCWKEV